MPRKDLSQALEAWLLDHAHDPVPGEPVEVEDGGHDGGIEIWYRSVRLKRKTYTTTYEPEGLFEFLLDWREFDGS